MSTIAKLTLIIALCGSAAAQTLDTYKGLTALPCSGGATGYFYVEKHSNQWLYCSPLGNGFWRMSPYVEKSTFLQTTPINVLTVKYGGSRAAWAVNNNNRLLSWNFNSIGEYAETYTLPVNTNGSHSNANSVKLPFNWLVNASVDMILHPALVGINEPVKNLISGVPAGIGGVYYGGRAIDWFDPKANTAYINDVAYQGTTVLTDGFNTPWILGITTDDTDYLFGQKNRGTTPVSPHANLGFITAVTKFDYTGVSGPWIDPKLYTKYAWSCGLPTIDFGYGVGKGYLDSKYGTIAALNAAWGTSGYYTTFCSDTVGGGYGVGHGVLDENGRNHGWMGSGSSVALTLSGVNATTAADMNQFVYDYSYKYAKTAVNAIRTKDTHHLIFSPPCCAAGYETRPQVLQAWVAAGMQVFTMSAPAQGNDFSGIKATYDLIGKPIYLWYAVIANADSALSGYTSSQGVPDYGTQANRGIHYATDLNSFLNATGTDGSHYIIGIDWWEYTDGSFAEKTNWGLISDRDNGYNAVESVNHSVVGFGGYTTVAEAGNYGDFLTPVTAANLALLNTLISGPSVPTITSGGCGNGTVEVPYTCNMTATGGTLPYTWSFILGGLTACTGLSLNSSTGVISGTPTVAATCSFTERVTDAAMLTADQPNSVTINVQSGIPVQIKGQVVIKGTAVIK